VIGHLLSVHSLSPFVEMKRERGWIALEWLHAGSIKVECLDRKNSQRAVKIMKQSTVKYRDQSLLMYYDNSNDEVQKFISSGCFYEEHVLKRHAQLIPSGGVVVDVGANIGNHTIFYSNFSAARRVFCLEPNPVARRVLLANIEASGNRKVDTTFVEYGAGKVQGVFHVAEIPANNLGAATLEERGKGRAVMVAPLDSLFKSERIDFMKIDVEGMEIDVLKGAYSVIRDHRPIIHVEVNELNLNSFYSFLNDVGYDICDLFRQYLGVWDFVIFPGAACISRAGLRKRLKVHAPNWFVKATPAAIKRRL
jgi:FkbM family methyltransferase